ncbi:NAD(P)/FAD-dependent oxidoreductase [Planctomicrobium sp. SH664]|uniref:NAD(P)/FAD-dependent oxidoreductase n=1 Tax=Planctomicrobium sp. SH664 TaxID=3448125 RepID=UPI003F5C7BE5
MELVSPQPFWLVQNGLIATYPALDEDIRCDVVVLGAGITGALISDRLSKAGLDVVVVDRRDVGQGSTSATTGLLQYEIDVHLHDLMMMRGEQPARRAYQLCVNAVHDLQQLADESPVDCGFLRQQSLYVASRPEDLLPLRKEFDARNACGIDVEYLPADELRERFGIEQPAAILSHEAAVCDAYRLAHGLLSNARTRGARIFDRTEITSTHATEHGVTLTTNRASMIFAREVIHATGFEAAGLLREKIVNLKSTYAIATQPLLSPGAWPHETLYWETARPYLYFRKTADGRLIVGGEDDPYCSPMRRDARIGVKAVRLQERLSRLLPHAEIEIEHAWGGTFGETRDGLAYIGRSPEIPSSLFALGFGGNGISFGVIAARILLDLVLKRNNTDTAIFRFGR